MDFTPFPKVPHLSRECVITEKLDGTNASVWIIPKQHVDCITPEFTETILGEFMHDEIGTCFVKAASRKRFITPGKSTDNFGFAAWVCNNFDELTNLGPGAHYGEWWGQGIQRGYDLGEKRFSLFNVGRWTDHCWSRHISVRDASENEIEFSPACCGVVPVLYRGNFGETVGDYADKESIFGAILGDLWRVGSKAAHGFMNPEGIMIYHTAARQYFKKTFEYDGVGKEISTTGS